MNADENDSGVLCNIARVFDRLEMEADKADKADKAAKIEVKWLSPERGESTSSARRTAKLAMDFAADNLKVVKRAIDRFGCPSALNSLLTDILPEYAADRWEVDTRRFEELMEKMTEYRRSEPPGPSFSDFLRRCAGELEKAGEQPKRRGVRRPSERDLKIAQVYENTGKTQKQIADFLTAIKVFPKAKISQKTVSDSIKKVNRSRRAQGLPEVRTRGRRGRGITLPNDMLDMGKRQHEGLGLRKRGRKERGKN